MLNKSEISKIVDHFREGRIGDVLSKITFGKKKAELVKPVVFLVGLWGDCDWSKSLQQIADDGWETLSKKTEEKYDKETRTTTFIGAGLPPYIEQLKSPARELFEFLNTLLK